MQKGLSVSQSDPSRMAAGVRGKHTKRETSPRTVAGEGEGDWSVNLAMNLAMTALDLAQVTT